MDFRHVHPRRVSVEKTDEPENCHALCGGARVLARSVQVQLAKLFVALARAIRFDAARGRGLDGHAFFFARSSFASFSIVRRCKATPNRS